MQFRDYRSAYDDFKSMASEIPRAQRDAYLSERDVDLSDFESAYAAELAAVSGLKDRLPQIRMTSELEWYRCRRPYFNVYPLIERKLLELDEDIDLSELHLPFTALEVRTARRTMLIANSSTHFVFVVELPRGEHQQILMRKTATISHVLSHGYTEVESDWWSAPTNDQALNASERRDCLFIAAGTCLLAQDRGVVAPVLLNKHRRDGMTPAEIAQYAAKAIQRTGRIGFDVGRDIERMKATAHYRNGCFAKYYVGKDHECYPPNAVESKVPIIKWRSGAVVNKDNLPKVPTGFKDTVSA